MRSASANTFSVSEFTQPALPPAGRGACSIQKSRNKRLNVVNINDPLRGQVIGAKSGANRREVHESIDKRLNVPRIDMPVRIPISRPGRVNGERASITCGLSAV